MKIESTDTNSRNGPGHSLPLLVGRLRAARKKASRFVEYRTTRAEVVDAVRMLDEAANALEEAYARSCYAEIILERLATGFWHHTLNEHSPGENIGDMVLDYWRTWNGEIPPPRNLSSNAERRGSKR